MEEKSCTQVGGTGENEEKAGRFSKQEVRKRKQAVSMLPVSKRGVLCYFVAPGDIVVVV